MASTFTLNFCLSGIQGYGWGSFNQPGLLNFGVFSVSTLHDLHDHQDHYPYCFCLNNI